MPHLPAHPPLAFSRIPPPSTLQQPGKPRQADNRTTLFKRAVDVNYHLKMKASR